MPFKTAFKIATWNVNSLKVRLPQVLDYMRNTDTDVLCLQEIKMTDEAFPIEAFTEGLGVSVGLLTGDRKSTRLNSSHT